MEIININGGTVKSPLDGTERVEIQEAAGGAGSTKQTTTQDIANLVGGSSVRSWKDPAYVATTANIALTGDQTIDGISTAGGIRVLVKDQSDFTQNGIYLSSSGAWSRATDSDTAGELEGAAVTVQDGVVNGNTTWVQTADGITLGVTGIEWVQFATTPNAANISFTPAGGIAATNVQAAIEELDGDVTTRIAAAVIGVQDLFFPADSFGPRITNGCDPAEAFEMATSLANIVGLPFDQTTQEFAQVRIVPPRKWNGGTITIVPYWTAISGSGTVRWAFNGGMYRNDDALTVAFGTAQNSDDTLTAVNDLCIGPETSAITLSGTHADGVYVLLQVARDPSNDTLNADAIFLGASVRFTTDAAIDG